MTNSKFFSKLSNVQTTLVKEISRREWIIQATLHEPDEMGPGHSVQLN